jgi:glycosyltransferase involved in cell wall biosynthesis
MNKISVIMPVYNTEKYLEEAIESILTQTFKNFEFIIIDDFSSDNSYKICIKYAKKDKRLKLYKYEKNM